MNRKRLGELLIATGYLREDQLKKALEEQAKWGGKLGRLLTELRMVNEDVVLRALSKQLALPLSDLSVAPQLPRELLVKLDGNFALSNSVCPEKYDANGRVLRLAMLDHSDVKIVDEARRRTGLRIETSLAAREPLSMAIHRLYGMTSANREGELSTSDFRRDSSPNVGAAAAAAAAPAPDKKDKGTGALAGTGISTNMSMFETGDFGADVEESLKLDIPIGQPPKRKR